MVKPYYLLSLRHNGSIVPYSLFSRRLSCRRHHNPVYFPFSLYLPPHRTPSSQPSPPSNLLHKTTTTTARNAKSIFDYIPPVGHPYFPAPFGGKLLPFPHALR
ncbi:unnamed protein product [Linum trigynum]|uniref:Uncharacterized protein n=1 Tax=Linum trigynum TaxID=586398 RepID=A0AAV2G8S0_9ROSI